MSGTAVWSVFWNAELVVYVDLGQRKWQVDGETKMSQTVCLLMTYIRKVKSSNLGCDTSLTHLVLSVLYSVQENTRICFKLGHDHFLTLLSNL